jgi:hypothetical protein
LPRLTHDANRYDVTDPTSFQDIKKQFELIEKSAPKTAEVVLIGNKNDLSDEKKVDPGEIPVCSVQAISF